MAQKRDYYEVLGLRNDAAANDIKSAYRRLARQHHPDANPGDAHAEERFKELNEAYSVLSDPEKRQRYDRFGHGGVSDNGDGGFGGVDPFDLFDMVFGTGRARQQPTGPQRGADLRYDLELSLEEYAAGGERTIQLHRYERCERCSGSGAKPGTTPETCSTCRGSGQVRATQRTLIGAFSTITTCRQCGGDGKVVRDPCSDCGGAGAVRKRASLTVKIPAGIDDRQPLVVRSAGEAGPNGGAAGDLYVFLHVHPHDTFERHGRDLACEVEVSMARAALGGPVEVPTLDGPQKFTLRPGTQPGDVFRIRGLGLPDHRRGGRGDLLFLVQVRVPTDLNAKQRKALEEFARTMGEDVPGEGEDRPQEGGGLFEWVRNTFMGRKEADRE